MRLAVCMLMVLAAQSVAAQTQFIGVPNVPKAQPAPPESTPAPKGGQVKLPPTQPDRQPVPRAQAFPQCNEDNYTADPQTATAMFETVLGVKNPFGGPLFNKAKKATFALGVLSGSLIVRAGSEKASALVCQRGRNLEVALTHWSGKFRVSVEPRDENRVHIAETTGGETVPSGIYGRATK